MDLINWVWEKHPFLMHQLLLLPFANLFYFLARRGYLSLTFKYLFLSCGGCVLAIITMGVHSWLLLISVSVFVLLVRSLGPQYVHPWVFGVQMFWQTVWHLIIQYREYYLNDQTDNRLFLAVSSLMLLTQRTTSVSMDLQENKVVLGTKAPPGCGACLHLLPLISYALSFTTLLGGPLCSYAQFVSSVEGIGPDSETYPLSAVSLKIVQVLLLELARYHLTYFLKLRDFDPPDSSALSRLLWVWGLAFVSRMRYYSHWKMSECLNAGLGLGVNSPSQRSDGDLWTTEASPRVSEFARRWNATTASWLRRLVFQRCRTCPLVMTFGFSVWWHGLHPGQVVGFLCWAAAVKADHRIHGCLKPKLTSIWRKMLYACFSWINTQLIITCVVVAVEFRDMFSLRLLLLTNLAVFPLLNIILLFLLSFKVTHYLGIILNRLR